MVPRALSPRPMTPPAAESPALAALRAATAEAHQRLEDAVDIGRAAADPARYRELLARFLGFYRPLEAALAHAEIPGLDPAARRKTPWLEADLRALGLDGSAVLALPDCPALPATDTPERALGCLYVLEGSTLGGRHISATLLRGSPVPEGARRFFAGYGADTGARWREFLLALENFARAAGDAAPGNIAAAGRETFARLQAWIMRG